MSRIDILAFKSSQSGGALVETLVLAIALLPLLFMIPFIGNLIDIKQTTIQASRFVAWEQTVTVGHDTPNHVKSYFYDAPTSIIHTAPSELQADSSEHSLWHVLPAQVDQGVSAAGHELLVSFSDGGGYFVDAGSDQNGVALAMGEGIKKMGSSLEFLDNVQWDIESDGLVDAGVQVNVLANHAGYIAGKSCDGGSGQGYTSCVSAHTSILVDGWGVADNALAENRSRALVPGAALQKVGNALSKLGKIPTFKEFTGLQGAFGFVDSTQLPLDRYSGTYVRAE